MLPLLQFVIICMCMHSVGQIVDRLLVPPGIIEFMDITSRFTDITLKDSVMLFKASGWDRRDMTKSMGGVADDSTLNVFVPVQGGFGALDAENKARLMAPHWKRHLRNFLQHLMFAPAMTMDELKAWVQSQGGTAQKTMLSGKDATFQIDGNTGELTVGDGGGKFIRPYDMKAVDG